tara:strand:- start:136 stop:510 length:375 start_codon:yes stop_codon:yes gene_type:complete
VRTLADSTSKTVATVVTACFVRRATIAISVDTATVVKLAPIAPIVATAPIVMLALIVKTAATAPMENIWNIVNRAPTARIASDVSEYQARTFASLISPMIAIPTSNWLKNCAIRLASKQTFIGH